MNKVYSGALAPCSILIVSAQEIILQKDLRSFKHLITGNQLANKKWEKLH